MRPTSVSYERNSRLHNLGRPLSTQQKLQINDYSTSGYISVTTKYHNLQVAKHTKVTDRRHIRITKKKTDANYDLHTKRALWLTRSLHDLHVGINDDKLHRHTHTHTHTQSSL